MKIKPIFNSLTGETREKKKQQTQRLHNAMQKRDSATSHCPACFMSSVWTPLFSSFMYHLQLGVDELLLFPSFSALGLFIQREEMGLSGVALVWIGWLADWCGTWRAGPWRNRVV